MPRSASSSSTSRNESPNRKYQRTANTITSGGNRKPENAERARTGTRVDRMSRTRTDLAHAVPHCQCNRALAGALDDQVALELVDRAEDMEDQPPGRRGGVDGLGGVMRKVVESTLVSLDGVIGDPQVWGERVVAAGTAGDLPCRAGRAGRGWCSLLGGNVGRRSCPNRMPTLGVRVPTGRLLTSLERVHSLVLRLERSALRRPLVTPGLFWTSPRSCCVE